MEATLSCDKITDKTSEQREWIGTTPNKKIAMAQILGEWKFESPLHTKQRRRGELEWVAEE